MSELLEKILDKIIINDGDTESLIRKYLKAGVMTEGRYERTDREIP